MKNLIRFLISAVSVITAGYLMENFGIQVDNFTTALLVALVLALLNFFFKPILILLTLPLTVITLGIFLIFINAIIIYITGELVGGFEVSSIWSAFFFGLIYSVVDSFLEHITGVRDKKDE